MCAEKSAGSAVRQNWDIDIHEEFKVWLKDRQLRPCFGTSEKDVARHQRSDLSRNGAKRRVEALLKVLKEAEIPLNMGAMTYNAKCQRSEAFHIKYAVPPDVYVNKFCKKFSLQLQVNQKILESRFRKDYYGDFLLRVQHHVDNKTAVAIPGSGNQLLRAPDDELIDTGPVLVFNREPVTCAGLTDEVINEFEKAVFKAYGAAVWFSVCFFVTNDVLSVDKACLRIGAKVSEARFIEIAQPGQEIALQFMEKYDYKPPKRQYYDKKDPKWVKRAKYGFTC